MGKAKILSFGYQYTGDCITKEQLTMVNFTTCSLDESVKLQCGDLDTKKYTYPDTGMVFQPRRLHTSSHSHHTLAKIRHGRTSFHCSDKIVPWMKVQIHGSDLIRCAYRFGTLLTSEERSWADAQEHMKNHTPNVVGKFWVQSYDGNSCVVGFDDLNLLKEPLEMEQGRAEIWTLWILFGCISLVVLGCAIYLPDEPTHHQQTEDALRRVSESSVNHVRRYSDPFD